MNPIKPLTLLCLAALLLSACGAPAASEPAPTSPPTSAPLPIPTDTPASPAPKTGKWSGEKISFTVASPTEITDFVLKVNLGPTGTCEIKVASTAITNGGILIQQDFDVTGKTGFGADVIRTMLGEKGTIDVFGGQFASPTEFSGKIVKALVSANVALYQG